MTDGDATVRAAWIGAAGAVLAAVLALVGTLVTAWTADDPIPAPDCVTWTRSISQAVTENERLIAPYLAVDDPDHEGPCGDAGTIACAAVPVSVAARYDCP